ncbi:MAG: DUF2975 domain-containing protein [Ruminococcus sp.]|uniref:DUF2975 domain-containing protein n=1 Tax=Ruminococcus sp. TaxID=41978 RepID=UPI0028737F8A|nr:DUF2975 domain-containing protein [Ruminococcus sp.]MBQ3284649.1 DUF2975 domain-containing protein [Ruminococcus sp.]
MEYSVKRKINIFGKVAKIITMIIIVFLLVAEGFLLTGGVIVACVPKDSVTLDAQLNADMNVNTGIFGFDDGKFSVKAGNTDIVLGEVALDSFDVSTDNGVMNVNGGVRNVHFDLNSVLLLIVYGMISLASVIVALFFFRALMKEFVVCDSPFCDGVVKKMRNFAIALIPCVVVAQGMKAAIGAVIGVGFNLQFDFVYAAFVFIIFVLTMIFKYGTMLQKEHDETV